MTNASTQPQTKETFLDTNGFLDVPQLMAAGELTRIFPGLLSQVETIREQEFPCFIRDRRVYFDNGATTQEPSSVIKEANAYRLEHTRGSAHSKNSAEARRTSELFDAARHELASFFQAKNYAVAFTSGTTGSSNFLAGTFPFTLEDLLVISELDHNSQVLTPRQQAERAGAKVAQIRQSQGRMDLEHLAEIVQEHPQGNILVTIIHGSNVTGSITDPKLVREIIGEKPFLYLDMAQTAGHIPITLDDRVVDFAACSAHKMYGPQGMGGFFANKRGRQVLTTMISGGGAVQLATRNLLISEEAPARYEPGTPNYEGAFEWMLALRYLKTIGMERIAAHDHALGTYLFEELAKISEIETYDPPSFHGRLAVHIFNVGSVRRKNYDAIARKLDDRGFSVRDGCFCVHIGMPLLLGIPEQEVKLRAEALLEGIKDDDESYVRFMKSRHYELFRPFLERVNIARGTEKENKVLTLPGAVRASPAFYNTIEEAYQFINAVREIAREPV
jgi:cysteine desulfurase/selenocysteine lyase